VTDFWVCGQCRSLNRGRTKACYACRAPYAPYDPDGSGVPERPAVAAAPTAPAATTIAGGFPPEPSASPEPMPTPPPGADASLGLAGGLIGGATGAIVATALWYGVVTATHLQAGIVAIAVGWIVGQGVVLGAGRPSLSLVGVSVAFTVLALAVSQTLITVQIMNELSVEIGGGVLEPLFSSPGRSLELLRNWFEFDPLTILFWAIALFEAVVIPWRRTMSGAVRTWPSIAR
jgi:hypothetical protein